MKSLSSILIAIFAFMFWAFRLITTILYSLGVEFVAAPIDITKEVALLFITFICICYIAKRKLLPVTIYLIIHLLYYGFYLYQNLTAETLTLNNYMDLFFAVIGIAIPIAAFFDVLLDRNRKAHPVDKQTDWFYKNKDYDRKMDERADRNQYRTLDK
ncbi:MAG: hypothetical protein ACI4UU_04540 [Clostridia bacterium]